MSIEQTIKMLCIKKDITVSDLAKINGTSPQNFYKKLKRNTLNVDDLKAIAQSVGCKYETKFVLENGDTVEY